MGVLEGEKSSGMQGVDIESGTSMTREQEHKHRLYNEQHLDNTINNTHYNTECNATTKHNMQHNIQYNNMKHNI